jgi:hypothetical protein
MNKKVFLSGTVFLLGFFVTPILVQGMTTNITPQEAKQKASEKFCTGISTYYDKLTKKMSERSANFTAKKAERANRWQERIKLNATRLTDIRKNADAALANSLNNLKAKATTDAQKAAIEAFSKAEQEAVAKKRSAVDGARTTFLAGMQKSITENKAETEAVTATFKNSIASAFKTAESSCAGGTDSAAAMSTFRASVKTAQQQMASDRRTKSKLSTAVDPLIQARKATMEKARTEFRGTMESALQTLKAAFPDGTVTITINL